MAEWNNIDTWRKGHMAVAEAVDAWRIVPRLIVAGYAAMMWVVVKWYMDLKPSIIEGCDIELIKEACISSAPSTQHAAVLTAVVGVAAAVFAFYANSGRQWNGFTHWNREDDRDGDGKVDNSEG